MSTWTRVYDDAQRAAIETAYVDKGTRIATIMRLAAAGELPGPDNTPLEAFPIPYASVAYIAKRAKRRREGQLDSTLADKPAPEANETLRKRLISYVDHELQHAERLIGKPNRPNPEHIRGLARVAREASAIPGPNQQRLPPKLGQAQGPHEPTTQRPLQPLGAAVIRAANTHHTQHKTEHSEITAPTTPHG